MILGTSDEIPKFWQLMGKHFASKDIAESLGEGMYDDENTLWCLKILDDKVVSFGAVINKPKFLLFTYGYTLPEYRGNRYYIDNILARENRMVWGGVRKEIRALCTGLSVGAFKQLGYIERSKRGRYTWVAKTLTGYSL